MSVSLTEPQVLARTKTVTRRLGWTYLKPGDRLTLCRKVMGRRKGEPLVRITEVEVVDVSREPLCDILPAEVIAEGFPDWLPGDFIDFFCRTHKGCQPWTEVTRIEWRYLDAMPQPSARNRYCICEGVCGYDDADYADECVEVGCTYCADEHARRNAPRLPGEVPLFGEGVG